MNWVIFIFGSGLAFFLGVASLLAGLAAAFGRRRAWRFLSTIMALLGLTLVATSATPLPKSFYVVSMGLTLAALVALRSNAGPRTRSVVALVSVATLVWIGGTAHELWYQFPPRIKSVGTRHLYVFGDSWAVGFKSDGSDSWPVLLAEEHNLQLSNFARTGATAADAAKVAESAELGEGLVLIEIGGNDLLGPGDVGAFAKGLESLLERVSRQGHPVVMLELPVPPFYGEFGRVQRRLASQFRVVLVPKRAFAKILAVRGATFDSLHLTDEGQTLAAEEIWKWIRPAYE